MMTVQSNAYFGVRGQAKNDAIRDVRSALSSLDLAAHGVKKYDVQRGPDDSIQIILHMLSSDLDQADRDADSAATAILALLRDSPNRDHLRERQRELVLS